MWHMIGFGIIAVLVTIDLLSKYFVGKYLTLGQEIVLIPHFLSLTNIFNDGAAFNTFSGAWIFLLVFAIIFVIALVVFQFWFRPKGALWFISFVLVISGAIGNLVDRIIPPHFVRDMISISFFPPVFNIADCMLVVGVILMVAYFLFFRGTKDVKDSSK